MLLITYKSPISPATLRNIWLGLVSLYESPHFSLVLHIVSCYLILATETEILLKA